MSWFNPSPDEADDAYRYYKGKYAEAASQKRASEMQEQAYFQQRKEASSQMSLKSSQKINFEERLEGIENIIAMLEGNNALNDVPNAISKACTAIARANVSYMLSVVSEMIAASLEDAFTVSKVEEDSDSASALQKYKAEKDRLAQEIENLKAQIAALENTISSLSSKINACNSAQASLRASMNSSAYEMDHYRNFIQ